MSSGSTEPTNLSLVFASIVTALLTTIDNLSDAILEIVGFVVKFVPNTSSFALILLFIADAKVIVVEFETAFAVASKVEHKISPL